MQQTRRWRDPEDEEAGDNRRTQSLAALAFSLFLVVVSVGLIHALHNKAVIEDCVLSGRSNCGRGWSWPAPPGQKADLIVGLPPG